MKSSVVTTIARILSMMFADAGAGQAAAEQSLTADIGSRRELFVDRFLIEKLDGAGLKLHSPRPAGTVLEFNRPYEGVFCGYVTVIKDGQAYRMYYRGLPYAKGGVADHSRGEVTCYAESRDGVHWTKPSLRLFEVLGTRDNNVILMNSPACHNFSPFLDSRPEVPAAKRFKAVGGTTHSGLLALVSADGIRWSKLRDGPILTKGAFDSQNVVFFSESEACYACYFRTFKEAGGRRYRWISRTTSKDFIQWTEPVEMIFSDGPPEQFYTNQTHPYFRAPHIYVALPARFMPGRRVITEAQARELGVVEGYSGDCSDAVLMTTRGGRRYDRTFLDSFIRPGMGLGNWVSRSNYPALGIIPTGLREMSCYVQRNYAQPSHCLERLTLRTDGFVSVHASYRGGEMLTKPLRFRGKELAINVATSAAGSVRVEIQDVSGKAIPGCSLAEAIEIIGDDIDRVVSWKTGPDIGRLAGRPVRLRFAMRDADLYSMRFR